MLAPEYATTEALMRVELAAIFEQQATELGERCGFVRRRSKVTAAKFVQMLVLSSLGSAAVTLTEMVAVGEELGVQVSVPGLNQRLGEPAVQLLQGVLQAVLALASGVPQPVAVCPLFAHFSAVHLQDSTYLTLPAAMSAAWGGAGGNASSAGAKIWLSYEYLCGTIVGLEVGPGRCADQACTLAEQVAQPQSLHLFDLGFFTQARLAHLAQQQSYFVCRHQPQTALYTSTGQRLDLEQLLAQAEGDQVDLTLHLGQKVRLPVRLLAQRVPQAVADARRRKAKAVAKRRRRTLAPATLRLLDWSLFCTNVPAAWWTLTQVLAVYRLRWQVELLFKLCKSQAGLAALGDWRPVRILCQLYARLIGLLLVQHWLGPWRFAAKRELSLAKAFTLVQRQVPLLVAAIAQGWHQAAQLWLRLLRRCLRLGLKDARTQDPSTFACLLALQV